MAQVAVQRVCAQWGSTRLQPTRRVVHRARAVAPKCEFDVDNASILVAGKQRKEGGAEGADLWEAPSAERCSLPQAAETMDGAMRCSLWTLAPPHLTAPPPLPAPRPPTGGGGCALQITKKLKDAGSWVWQLQRTDVRR